MLLKEVFLLRLSNCRKCALCKKQESGFRRTQVVLGRGSDEYGFIFVGEAPGEFEDKNGDPFCPEAPAGEMYDKILKNLSLVRKMVYTTNVVKCRPTQVGTVGAKNREPSDIERDACRPWMVKEITKIKPKLIVTMGATALRSVVGVGGVLRHAGRLIRVKEFDCFVFPIFHPASIIYDNDRKIKTKAHILALRAALREIF